MVGNQSADAPGQLQYVSFNLEDETYGINVMQVQEVLRATEVAPVPGAPPYVLGIINLRGNVVSVIDARTRFGLPAIESTDLTRIIVIETLAQIIGIMVDSVAEVVDIMASEIEAPPNVGNEDSSKYIDGVVSRDEKLLILVNLNKLLNEAEWREVAGF